MKNSTVISYPAPRNESLLSLTDLRSRYMVPFGGRFRIIDFTLRNAFSAGVKNTIIYNNMLDDLEVYVDNHPLVDKSSDENKIIPLVSENLSIDECSHIVEENATPYYILYNGDIPSIIDFKKIFKKYKASKVPSVLFKLKYNNVSSMANTVLVTNRRTLFATIKRAQKEGASSPNVFEMLINMLIIKGVKQSTFSAYYRPLKSIPDYYNANMEIFKGKELGGLIYNDEFMKSGIKVKTYAQVGESAKISGSFLSDGCIIDGRVENSIIFPGVVVSADSVVRDSILLPYVTLGKKVYLDRVVIDEYTDHYRKNRSFNVAEKTRIGSDVDNFKNSRFPKSIYSSITLVGKNCIIPDNVRIGSACYIPSGTGVKKFEKKKVLHDGLSME